MRYLLLFPLLFVFEFSYGQTQLNELYTISPGNHYPQNMSHVAAWINGTLSPIFVRDLQYSDNIKSASKFMSFSLYKKLGRSIILPEMKGIKLITEGGSFRLQYTKYTGLPAL